MALTVEDATGLENADSYVSLSDFNTFRTNRNMTATATDAAKEAALRDATSFIDAHYAFPSTPLKNNQALSFPRFGTFYVDGKLIAVGVPAKLVEACCLLANEALAQPLDPMDDSSRVTRQSSKVDVIEKTVEYQGAKGARQFPTVTRILAQIGGTRKGRTVNLVRS